MSDSYIDEYEAFPMDEESCEGYDEDKESFDFYEEEGSEEDY